MSEPMVVDPESYLRGEPLDPVEIEERYPNAKRVLKGGLFISHSGEDFMRIREAIVNPVVYDRFMDGFFLHNRGSGGSKEYRELVRTALYYLDKFLLVVSEHSVRNAWVRAEVSIACTLRRPMILCLLDGSDPRYIHDDLRPVSWYKRMRRRTYVVDFRSSLEYAQKELARRLDELLKHYPYERSFT